MVAVEDKKCDFPGCLCSIPSCPCHRQHPDPETWGTGDPVWESAMLRDVGRAANYWQEKYQRHEVAGLEALTALETAIALISPHKERDHHRALCRAASKLREVLNVP